MNDSKSQTKAENWVKARHEWSAQKAFNQLHKQVKEDVKTRNSILGGTPSTAFKIEPGHNFFTVMTDEAKLTGYTKEPADWVQFNWDDTGITVKSKEAKVALRATPVLTDEGECKLKLESGEELSCSQFCRRALDKLFFA